MGILCGVAWLLYSLLKFDAVDKYILIPNALGIPFCLFQIVIWLIYWKKSKSELNNKEENNESSQSYQKVSED